MSKDKAEQTVPEPLQTAAVAPETATPAPAAEPVLDDLEALKSKAAQAQKWYDQLLRTTADFDNYRKRAVREKADAVRFANEALLQKLVPVLDNFEMAMAAAEGPNASVATIQSGVAMIHQQFKSALSEAGLEEIQAHGRPFDPNVHEAVLQEESTEAAEGSVLRQLRKGYKLRERLLRPATVVVAKAAQTESSG